ncbi:hypothetical protein M758_12G146100 [Ceratodon purpureus]|nr:hypothetical protein M758_12G146100 [Ceratodon purpureus]
MVSKCEPGKMFSVAKLETPALRSKLDYSGGSPVPSPEAGTSSRVRVPIDIAELPLDSACEPPSPSSKHSAGYHVGGKILKFLKLRKSSKSSAIVSQEALQPALTTFRFQDQGNMSKRFASVEDVDLERYHYDSDEHSENVSTSGANCERRRRNSCSTSASSSTRSSASAQSFRSMTSRSSVTTPRSSFILGSGYQSNAQLMANILISISHLDEEDENGSDHDHPALNGPHESAWHQPRDEILAASPGGARISSAKQSSGRNTPRIGRCSLDVHLTSPGPSRRFGKLDLSRLDKLR